ncbi:MAG: hypothetical protein ACRDSK_13325 [Actinophytocola sp.]|uniref:hypothetical protein n=1 Tax=Actinophytocola sp. TaxID=1872138 RepID=UPI003D6B7AE7
MNPTLPAPRDLHPHKRTRIRAELERAVTRRPRRVWLVPALTASAAVAVVLVTLVVWPSTQGDDYRIPAGPTPTAPPSTGTFSPPISTAPPPPGARPSPAIPGVSPDRRNEIERNCAGEAGKQRAVLYRLIEDAAGRTAVLYTPDGEAIECPLGVADSLLGPGIGARGPLDWLPGPVSLDLSGATPGDGANAGLETAIGRVTSDVARVTYTTGGVTTDAVVDNGTYVARILHPNDWDASEAEARQNGVVRAYDARGELIGTVDQSRYYLTCYRAPGGALLPWGTSADPSTCREAVPWR